ncbi:MAG TPA: ABC transporter ATP-binding protein [Candidatus Methanofastidiosum sp.]|jgi:ABC-2 type transport system ATP-binding protein|nr:ABC transporter ATP-binding protein [Methanofastidiosum sp.]
MTAIFANNISKSFGDYKALDGINLKVKEGEFFGLLGPNGAGKTTLVRILTGQLDQDSGNAEVMNLSTSDSIEIKRISGIVPEAESPPSFLTAEEFLKFVCRLRNLENIDSRVSKWLDFFEIEEKKEILCKDLSKGQRQKMMLSAAFIHEPKLLFLDEPFINLDPIFQKKVRGYLFNLVKEGCTIFMCTHILDIAEKLCTEVAVINKGKIISQGSLDKIRLKEGEHLEDIFMRLIEE